MSYARGTYVRRYIFYGTTRGKVKVGLTAIVGKSEDLTAKLTGYPQPNFRGEK